MTTPPYLAAEACHVCALRAACRHAHISALDGAAHGTAGNHGQATLEGGAAGSCRGSSIAGSVGTVRRQQEDCQESCTSRRVPQVKALFSRVLSIVSTQTFVHQADRQQE
jgi:hypothetical protein